jgi:hypothetical protein
MLCCAGLIGGLYVGQYLGGPWTYIAPAAGFGVGLLGDMKFMHKMHQQSPEKPVDDVTYNPLSFHNLKCKIIKKRDSRILKYFQIMLLISSVLLLIMMGAKVSSSETKETTINPNIIKMETTIEPSLSYEECVEVLPAQIMEYSFKTSEPVNFNIHYHAEKGYFYPVKKNDVSTLEGILNPEELEYYSEEQEHFCLMWKNPFNKNVGLTFEYKTKNK